MLQKNFQLIISKRLDNILVDDDSIDVADIYKYLMKKVTENNV